MTQLRSRVHHPFLVVGRKTTLRSDFLRPALTAARTSGALLLLPHTAFQDLSTDAAAAAREALGRYPAQLAVTRPPQAILELERRTGLPAQHYTDDDGWRRLRTFLSSGDRGELEPGDPRGKAPLPSLAEESVAELLASEGAPLPERLASTRTTRLVESALKRWGCDAAVAARLAGAPSFSAHYLLTHVAAALLPPESLDPVDLTTIACAAIGLDDVTDDEDARALFQDVTLAVDHRFQSTGG